MRHALLLQSPDPLLRSGPRAAAIRLPVGFLAAARDVRVQGVDLLLTEGTWVQTKAGSSPTSGFWLYGCTSCESC